MKPEWVTERCYDLRLHAIRLRDIADLGMSDEDKEKFLESSPQLKDWEKTKWEPFLAELLPGDEVWRFRSPPHTWANFSGCAGYVVLRDGQIVRTLTTLRS